MAPLFCSNKLCAYGRRTGSGPNAPAFPRTAPPIASATIANPKPPPIASIKPKNTIAGLFGLIGFSGKAAGSIIVNFSPLLFLIM